MALPFRLFSFCPRLSKRGGTLVASTAWRLRLLTLGGHYRSATIDPVRKEVRLYRRRFWLFVRRRTIAFKEIAAVTYGYRDMAIGTWWAWAHDSADLFSVGLRLVNEQDVHLFHFYGDGTFTNDGPLPDWLYWDDYVFDMSGTQERESRAFVNLVSMAGVTVVPGRT